MSTKKPKKTKGGIHEVAKRLFNAEERRNWQVAKLSRLLEKNDQYYAGLVKEQVSLFTKRHGAMFSLEKTVKYIKNALLDFDEVFEEHFQDIPEIEPADIPRKAQMMAQLLVKVYGRAAC